MNFVAKKIEISNDFLSDFHFVAAIWENDMWRIAIELWFWKKILDLFPLILYFAGSSSISPQKGFSSPLMTISCLLIRHNVLQKSPDDIMRF